MLTEKTQSIFYPKKKSYIFKLLILRKQIISSWDEYFTRIVVSLLIVFNKSVSVVDSCEYFVLHYIVFLWEKNSISRCNIDSN